LKIGVSHLRFEPLEDRTVPAFDLLISPGPTFGVIASTVSTVTTFQANQVGATLNVDDVP
jgi:hypothetical protein